LATKIETILKASARITKIVRGLKKFSRSSDGATHQDCPLTQIIEEATQLADVKLKKFSTQLICSLGSNAWIHCDEVEIEQVLVNLIHNAVDAIKHLPDRWVKIETLDQLNSVILRVTDSGRGIPEPVRNKLFEPFFTTKAVGEGTGLGLSITKGILDEHQASITVLADCPNTCFEIHFKGLSKAA
jgi:C4-dicarboxylate-specific signal transduction histidine kinase